ncbi:MAG: type VI secretion system tip protein VgrG [Planctomycetes bacterium]|nr:type VI secretion system tip protein VgrG [Planctomycetota bacterium]
MELPSTREGRVLRFQTPDLERNTLLVTSIEGREGISRPYRFEVDLTSRKPDLDTTALLQKPALIAIKQGIEVRGGARRGIQTLPIHGVLSSFEQGERSAEWTHYRAVLVPRFWNLSVGRRSRIFLDRTVPQIVEQVLKDHGMTPEDFQFFLSGEYSPREYVLQYEESDLDFVSRLLEHEGIFYSFEQEDERERIVFGDALTAYRTMPGIAAVPYRPQTQGGREGRFDAWTQSESVSRFHLQHGVVPRQVVLRDYNDQKPNVELRVEVDVAPHGRGLYYAFGDHYGDPGEGRRLAGVRAEEWLCRERIFTGRSDIKSLRAGVKIKLSEHYRADFNAEYLVTKVVHRAHQQLEGASATGREYSNEFVAIPSGLVFRPERLAPRPRISGTIVARVDAAGDGEYAELDDQGRYKVQVPLDLADRGRGTGSCWIRMAQPYAGPGYGTHWPLHKGQEVILTHLNGDPDRPVIAGALHDTARVNHVTSANQSQGILLSAGNNAVAFDDQQGSERLFLQTPGTFELRAGGSARELVEGGRHIRTGADLRIQVGGNRHENVTGDHKAKTGGEWHLDVVAHQMVKIGGNQNTRVGGNVEMMLAGHHRVLAGGTYAVKAPSVVVDGDELTLRVGPNHITLGVSGISIKAASGPLVLNGPLVMINSGAGMGPVSWPGVAVASPAAPEAPGGPGSLEAGSASADGDEASDEEAEERPASWIEIKLVDEADQPVPAEPFRVEAPDGRVVEGVLDDQGHYRVEGIQPGNCKIEFPNLDREAWEPA